jgi:hypothetical protein
VVYGPTAFNALPPGWVWSAYLLLGNGDGTFQPGASIGNTLDEIFEIVVADFDHDGQSDLALSDGFSICIMLGLGDGSFGSP